MRATPRQRRLAGGVALKSLAANTAKRRPRSQQTERARDACGGVGAQAGEFVVNGSFEAVVDMCMRSLPHDAHRLAWSGIDAGGFGITTPVMERYPVSEPFFMDRATLESVDSGLPHNRESTYPSGYLALPLDRKSMRSFHHVAETRFALGGTLEQGALPLYLVLASGLAKTYRTDTYGTSSNTLRLALVDEALAGIDDASAEEALGYFQSCGLQPIVATPEAEKTSRLSEMTSTRIDHFKGADGFGFAVSYDRDMEDWWPRCILPGSIGGRASWSKRSPARFDVMLVLTRTK